MDSASSDSRSSSSSAASPEMAAAAEALADLAHLAMRESSGADSGGEYVRRGNKRGKSESPPPSEVAESPTRCSDLPQERMICHRQSEKKAFEDVLIEPPKADHYDHTEMNLKVENGTKLPNTSLVGSGICSSIGCGKSRRNLTEEEKEARRIRRILANRESARQTIRRRQALCEELTKKAADLSLENDNLKRDMEIAMKEYQMLETKNKELKDQMAKVVKTKVEVIPGGHKPASAHIAPPTASPLFLYNHPPFAPLFWRPISQSQDPVLASHIPQNAIVMPSMIPFPVEGRHDSYEQENLPNTKGPRTPFYILPYPWFFPHTDHGHAVQSQSSNFHKHDKEEDSTNNQCSVTSSRAASHLETLHSFLPIRVKTELGGSLDARITDDLNELPAGFSTEGDDQQTLSLHKGRSSTELSLSSSPVKSMGATTTAKHEKGLRLDSTPHIQTSSEACHTPLVLSEDYCESIVHSCKKSAEAVAAAEARKRRKELTKLKNLHGRQCRMHC